MVSRSWRASRPTSSHMPRAGLGVQAGRRFVQEQHLGAMDEAEGDVEAAPHAARVRLHHPVGCVGDPDELEELGDAVAKLPSAHALHAPLEHEILAAGAVLVDARVLRHVADRAPDGAGLAADVVARDLRPAGVHPAQRGEDADGRRLARAVRTEQAEDLALAHGEGNAGQRLHALVALFQPLDDDRVHAPSVARVSRCAPA